ncbi:MAG: UbiX family flavin prenyltransferase [Mucinivorans sp.]
MTITIAITGASGSIYAQRLILRLKEAGHNLSVVFTENGLRVSQWELPDMSWLEGVRQYDNNDFFVPIASGSAPSDAMVIVPASMGMVGRVALGVSNDLVSRAADVMLKQGLPLVVVARELPFSLIHLRNLTTLKEAGAVVMTACPGFYSHPQTIEQLVDTVVDKIIGQLHINDAKAYRWSGQ